MESEERKAEAILKTIDGRESRGEVIIRLLSQSERTKESLKWLAVFWAVALVCVLVPMLHFVLVPAFLIVGPVVAFRVYSVKEKIASGGAACPVCGKRVTFTNVRFKSDFKEVCPECANHLYVSV